MRRTGLTLLLCLACLLGTGALAGPAGAAPSIESASFSLSSFQAGTHADLSAAVTLEGGGDPETVKELRLGLPPGFFLYPDVNPQCSVIAFVGGTCPIGAKVGSVALRGDFEGDPNHEFDPAPLYLMTPQADKLARLAFFIPEADLTVLALVTMRPTDPGLDITLEGFPQTVPLKSIALTLWGVPAAAVHDEERGGPSNVPEAPFTRNPTSCATAGSLTVRAVSWEQPDEFATNATAALMIGGCGKLAFSPSLVADLTSDEASAPSGLDLDLKVPVDLTPNGLSGSDAKAVALSLPPELSLDTEALAGLTTCSAAQAHLEGGPNECPAASSIGTVEGSVAGIDAPLEGQVYFGGAVAAGYRLFLLAAGGGVELRQQANLTYDETSEAWGIEMSFLPQLPLEALATRISTPGGPFVTPWTCGSFDVAADFTPWNGSNKRHATDGLVVATGPAGGPCPGPAEEVVVELDPPSIAADGASTTSATATVSDANGYLLTGDEVVFESTDPGQRIGPVTDHGDGTYSAQITASNQPGTSVVFAYDESVEAEVFGFAELTQTPLAAPPLLPAAVPPPPAVSPVVRLLGRPAKKTRDRTPTFGFTSSVAGSSFQCKLDRRPARPCKSPLTLPRLAFGRHTFKVRAVAPDGLASPFAAYGFSVRPPANPSGRQR